MNIVTSTSNMTHSNGAPHDPGFFQRIMTAISGVRQKAGDIGRDIIEHPGESALSVMRRVSQARETVGDVGREALEDPVRTLGTVAQAIAPTADIQDISTGIGKLFQGQSKEGLSSLGLGLAGLIPGSPADELRFARGMQRNRRSAQRLGMGDGPSGIRAPEGSEIRQVQRARVEKRRVARGKEQFPTEVFHATSSGPRPGTSTAKGQDFEVLDPWTHLGTERAAEERIIDLRGDFGRGQGIGPPQAGERIIPAQVRGDYFDIGNEPTGLDPWSPASLLEEGHRGGLFTEAEASRTLSRLDKDDARQVVSDLYKEKGFDGIRYTNGVEDRGSTSFLVFDPTNTRSRFAQFDPSRIGEAGLMLGGAGLAGASILNQRERGSN